MTNLSHFPAIFLNLAHISSDGPYAYGQLASTVLPKIHETEESKRFRVDCMIVLIIWLIKHFEHKNHTQAKIEINPKVLQTYSRGL